MVMDFNELAQLVTAVVIAISNLAIWIIKAKEKKGSR